MKKRVVIIFLLFIIIMAFIIIFNSVYNNKNRVFKYIELGGVSINVNIDTYNKVKARYNKYVKTNDNVILYDNEFNEVGLINEGVNIVLDDINIDSTTKFFKTTINNETYFINFYNLEKIDNITIDERYKNYIVYNKNIVTKDITSFYDSDDKLVYTINKSFEFPVIIKDDERYGVEFNNSLLFIKEEDVEESNYSYNTDKYNTYSIPVLNYHFVYEDDDSSCNQVICHSASQIKSHFSYIKENDYFTPTMKELEMYIDGKVQLPKSVVLTFDDGTRGEVAKKYIDEYQLNATLFIVTSRFKNFDVFKSDYIELHSHSDDLHNVGVCSQGQGGGIQCLDSDTILKDLKTSREKLNNTTVFCYPFYEYNSYSISLLKEAGFTMAFAGEYAGGISKVIVGADKFRLPRFVVVKSTTMYNFINFIN